MRLSALILLVIMIFTGCENPGQSSSELTTYQGQSIQNNAAPFLVNSNTMAKTATGILTLSEFIAEGTVYGLLTDPTIYAATGGEVLSAGTWVDNLSTKQFEISIASGLTLTYDKVTTVTIVESQGIFYLDANGAQVLFSGSGVVTTGEISTGTSGSATLISNTKFAIGGEGGENG